MDVQSQNKPLESHFPARHEFLGTMTSLSTSTPVCRRSKPVNALFNGDDLYTISASSHKMSPTGGVQEHDSGYVDSMSDMTFLSDHGGRLSAETMFTDTSVPQIQHSPPELHFYSPISQCFSDGHSTCSTQSMKTFQLFDIPEDEFCSGFKEMSVCRFDLGRDGGEKCNGDVSSFSSSMKSNSSISLQSSSTKNTDSPYSTSLTSDSGISPHSSGLISNSGSQDSPYSTRLTSDSGISPHSSGLISNSGSQDSPYSTSLTSDSGISPHSSGPMSNSGSPISSNAGTDVQMLNEISPSEPERFDRFLRHFSPREPDRLIGRKMGLDYVDIVVELHSRSIDTSLVLSYLEPADLCCMCQVSRQWKHICESSPSAERRMKEFVKKQKIPFTGKENYGRKLKDRQHRGLTSPTTTLGCVQNVELQAKPSSVTTSPTKQDISFSKAAQLLQNDERLRHCPKCHFASKVVPVEERGMCFKCGYDFCIKCLTEYHQARPCVPVACKKAKTDNVGGKKSKRNLKRL